MHLRLITFIARLGIKRLKLLHSVISQFLVLTAHTSLVKYWNSGVSCEFQWHNKVWNLYAWFQYFDLTDCSVQCAIGARNRTRSFSYTKSGLVSHHTTNWGCNQGTCLIISKVTHFLSILDPWVPQDWKGRGRRLLRTASTFKVDDQLLISK